MSLWIKNNKLFHSSRMKYVVKQTRKKRKEKKKEKENLNIRFVVKIKKKNK